MPVLNLLFRLFYWPYNIILSQWARQTKCSLVIILPPTVRTPSWANRECMFNARESCMNSNKRTTILRTIRTLGRFDGAQNNNNRSCFLFFFCTFFFHNFFLCFVYHVLVLFLSGARRDSCKNVWNVYSYNILLPTYATVHITSSWLLHTYLVKPGIIQAIIG